MKNDWILKAIIVAIIIISIAIVVVLLTDKNDNDDVTFYLIGDETIKMQQGNEYYEMGFVAQDKNGNSLDEYVTIENLVNINEVGTYKILYKLSKDNTSITLVRNVVIEKRKNQYYLQLNGRGEIKHLLGKEYTDDGCSLYSQDGELINIDINVSGYVNVNEEGVYTLIYSVEYEGQKLEATREVEVYDIKYNYTKTKNGNQIILNFVIENNNFKYTLLPDGTKETETNFSYIISKNDTYIFKFYDDYGNYKQEIIKITEFVSDLKCSGIINRNGTMLTINGSSLENGLTFDWYIDGTSQSGGNTLNLLYKSVNSAYVIVNNSGLTEKINCTITNNLAYKFVYDANNTKPFMKCGTYSANDKSNLENALKNAVNQAGYGTRAGVVEAARFLVGGLDYKVPYLGPKTVDYNLGRYLKIGLNIGTNTSWGCGVSGYTQGMDCTNFVYWAFVQAGLQVKSIYSTSNVYSINSVVDRLKVGDLLLTPNETSFSHVGIIIGIDSSSIYVAESTTGSINAIVTTRLSKSNLPSRGKFSKARLYEYAQDGNLTSMWVS